MTPVHVRGSKASSGLPAPVRTNHRLSPAGGDPYYSFSLPLLNILEVKQKNRMAVKG